MKINIDRLYKTNKTESLDNEYQTIGEMSKKHHKKEPYIFTVAAVNSSGNSTTSPATIDIVPNIVPTISSFTTTPSISGTSPVLNASISLISNGANVTKIVITSGSNTLTIDPTKVASSNTSGLNYNSFSQIGSNGITDGTYTFTITGLTPGTSYTFSAVATNSVGDSVSFSSIATTTAKVPDAPTSVAVTAANTGDRQCTVTFTAPAAPLGGGTLSYTATSSPGGLTATGTSGTTGITVTGLTNGTSYTFTVTASNSLGSSPSSTASTAVTPYGIPTAPTIVTPSSNKNSQIPVTFSGDTNNGSAITRYTVTATPISGTAVTATGTSSPITVTGLTNGTQYTITVTSTNARGTSSPSTVAATATPSDVPSMITGITPSPGSKLVTLSFTQPNTNGSPISSYLINAYYVDSNNASKYETISVDAIPSDNYSISGNTVTIKLYTKSNNATFTGGSTVNATQVTTGQTISKSVQPYDRVPLLYYPIGNEIKESYVPIKDINVQNSHKVNKCNKSRNIFTIFVIIVIILVILYLFINYDNIKHKLKHLRIF